MKKDNKLNKLSEIASKKSSKWIEKAKYREINKDWLDKSAKIAIKILRELRTQRISQVDLAGKLKVSPQYINKVVKGQENLSLETICKLERALGISLISVPSFDSSVEYSMMEMSDISAGVWKRQSQPI